MQSTGMIKWDTFVRNRNCSRPAKQLAAVGRIANLMLMHDGLERREPCDNQHIKYLLPNQNAVLIRHKDK